ncbi:MAG: hypothetical protein M1828_002113 [Chrysothrix sp. TS-e1954]|nr:MAG: hypothetical protein M1828_002113 [Chrysothrix sp. TS-e1954]
MHRGRQQQEKQDDASGTSERSWMNSATSQSTSATSMTSNPASTSTAPHRGSVHLPTIIEQPTDVEQKREPTHKDLLRVAYKCFGGEEGWKELPEYRREWYFESGYLREKWGWDNASVEERRARSLRDSGDPLRHERLGMSDAWPEWLEYD